MFINCFYDYRLSIMHLWEEIDGKRVYSKEKWVPYVFTPNENSRIHTIYGDPVRRQNFRTYHEYYGFCKNQTGGFYENKVKPDIQFLAERYYNIPDDDIKTPDLLSYSLDIETAGEEKGFPDVENVKQAVVLISVMNSKTKKVTTFGEREYNFDNVTYYHCENERDLLECFYEWMHKNPPDVIFGWNVGDFDVSYLINRTKKLFGDDTTLYQKLSPINIVNTWKSKGFNTINIEIAGVYILDYLQLYKWYSPNKQESYKLDFVANFELDAGKLDYSDYEDLYDLYKNDWKKYVDYNIVDVQLVDQLEDKLGYIKLVQRISLFTKCTMKHYSAMTSLIEGVFLTYYRRNALCAPFLAGGHQESFEAAYVKEPQRGMHHWCSSLDITSSYPSAIICLNMSLETYFGKIQNLSEKVIIEGVSNRDLPAFHMLKSNENIIDFDDIRLKKFNLALQKGLFTVAPNGSVFITTKDGVMSVVERQMFFKRIEVKNEMKKLRLTVSKLPESKEKIKLNNKINELFVYQLSLKIILNVLFGATSVPYSRYYNIFISTAVTSCGRRTIKAGEKFVNELLNDNEKLKDILKNIEGGDVKNG